VRCDKSLSQTSGGLAVIAATVYARPGDQLMRALKEGGQLHHAGLYARLLWCAMRATQPPLPSLAALVPIPADLRAAQRRGFNPACEIAVELSRLSRLPVKRLWLSRTRSAESQKSLDRAARKKSVCGLYTIDKPIPEVWVGLVDDVTTTGSTLDAAAHALSQAGARGVIGLVGAKTPTRVGT
jgi:predicted amidophosphoribosyltransferase